MFASVPNPLAYAEALVIEYGRLSQAADIAALLRDFVSGLASLSKCDLAQFYQLDATGACLQLSVECLDGALQSRQVDGLAMSQGADQLLQFALAQNRVVHLDLLDNSLYETGFLPTRAIAWRSLLCVPIGLPGKAAEGLVICASPHHTCLNGFAESLRQLGAFVLAQLHLLQHRPGLVGQQASLPAVLPDMSRFGLISKSASMRQSCRLIGKVVRSAYTVLLTGETGTGKEVVARVIHDFGPRRAQPFVVQNCAALPESLLESELFGYRKGAFTGADRDHAGLFDVADGGTLLLDEIGDMPLSLQVKLLRVLQENEIRPLGCSTTHKVDVRIIAATHRNLSALVSDGSFRQDLYYRLAQFPIELPALRQRRADIPELARHFADKTCVLLRRSPLFWSQAALERLCRHPFPGNVRELKVLVERAVLLCEGNELLAEHFPSDEQPFPAEAGLSLRQRLEQVERSLLLDCLRKNNGNQTVCARELGLPRRTLLYRLERLNITLDDRPRSASIPRLILPA